MQVSAQTAPASSAPAAAPGWSSSVSVVEPGGTVVSQPVPAQPAAIPGGPASLPDAAPLTASLPTTAVTRETRFRARPFRSFGVGVTGGFGGVGVEVATPLASRLNLRAGGSFFQYSGSYNADGIDINGEVKFRAASVAVDIFPFGNAFRISPGVTVYNGNNLNAQAVVPGGQSFDLGDGTYTSSPTDPVHGAASLTFGKRTAPSLTIGSGNLIPRDGRHWSVPFEIGFQYIGDPMLGFTLAGQACDNSGNCGDIASDPQAQANRQQEQDEINADIRPLRFYPILSVGVGYRFGH